MSDTCMRGGGYTITVSFLKKSNTDAMYCAETAGKGVYKVVGEE